MHSGGFPVARGWLPGIGPRSRVRAHRLSTPSAASSFLMLAEVLRLWTLSEAFPASRFWAFVAYNTTHVPWQGCSLHDLIQPAFSFLAGARCHSRSRAAKARASFGRMFAHAVWQPHPHLPRDLPALARKAAHLLDVRRHAHADWSGLLVPLPAGVRVAARADRGVHSDSGGLRRRSCSIRCPVLTSIIRKWEYARLAASLQGLPRTFQQELQPGSGVRCLVPEPVPARVAIPFQRRWLVHAELHPDAGDDDARPVVWPMVDDDALDRREVEGSVIGGVALTIAGLLLQWLHINPIVKRIWSSYTRTAVVWSS